MPDPNATLADTLFTELTENSGITIPVTDPDAAHLAQPEAGTGALYAAVEELTEADLTERLINGTGVFDGLMQASALHLQQEYEKGRITGKDYADVYLGSIQASMNTALQFLLARDQSYWQAQLAQRQARLAEIQAVTERVNIDLSKAKLATAVGEAKLMEAAFAKSKLDLAIAVNQIELTDAQVDKAVAEVTNLLPAQISKLEAETDQTLYQTANILPAQKLGIEGDTALKTYQLTWLSPAQLAGLNADNAGKTYTNDFLLPAQLNSLREQTEAHRAKTLDTRSDLAPVTGQIGVQKALQQEQITSYKRDAETKVAKMILDTWVTQKSMDEGLVAPTQLQDAQINSAMETLRTNLGL